VTALSISRPSQVGSPGSVQALKTTAVRVCGSRRSGSMEQRLTAISTPLRLDTGQVWQTSSANCTRRPGSGAPIGILRQACSSLHTSPVVVQHTGLAHPRLELFWHVTSNCRTEPSPSGGAFNRQITIESTPHRFGAVATAEPSFILLMNKLQSPGARLRSSDQVNERRWLVRRVDHSVPEVRSGHD
jgi:hypothetical protein